MGLFTKLKNTFNKNKSDVQKYETGLEKSRTNFTSKLGKLSNKYKFVNDEYFEDLEDILITSDMGISTTLKFIDKLKDRTKKEKITSPEELKEVIIDELLIMYVNNGIMTTKINFNENGPTVMLFVGVNGVGKTTTIGKLASKLKKEGKRPILVAADTFRAGAIEQLVEWATKIGVPVVTSTSKDPSSVIYDGISEATKNNNDVILIDTAGRLQNKTNLMNELSKINKVIKKLIPSAPHESILVIDATTGQNGISQAKAFKEVTDITGIVLTKLDGTAKGGIVLGIKEELGIPVKYIGLGEQEEDLQPFDIEKYIYSLFKDL